MINHKINMESIRHYFLNFVEFYGGANALGCTMNLYISLIEKIAISADWKCILDSELGYRATL